MNRFTKIYLEQLGMNCFPAIIGVVMGLVLFYIVGGVADDIYNTMKSDIDRTTDEKLKKAMTDRLKSIEIMSYTVKSLPFLLMGLPLFMFAIRAVMMKDILTLRNTELRMAKLKKMGVEKFIKYTKAILVDSNNKGYEMYETKNIIKDKLVKFVIYRDCSTSEQYVSFVRSEHATVDEAMAWKQRLTIEQYKRMELES